jgi:DeoR/GlpR family transcriptional regulator of sugar metabolism
MIGRRTNSAPRRPSDASGSGSRPGWTFLSNHGHVLACIAMDPEARVREIADRVGITERAVQRILGDLDEAGVITRTRNGRRSRYSIDADAPLRHEVESHHTVGQLLALLAGDD